MCGTTFFLFWLLDVTECILLSAYASLVGIPTGITCSAIELKICVITTWIRKYKPIIKKKKKKDDKIVLSDCNWIQT